MADSCTALNGFPFDIIPKREQIKIFEEEKEDIMNHTLPHVVSVHRSSIHNFSKDTCHQITLLKGLGVEGDAHCGKTVQHRSRVANDPDQPNLRQVHLIQAELFDELEENGFSVDPGQLGENITTRGIDLMALPEKTRLKIGTMIEIELTGLRNPCAQIDDFKPGLLDEVLHRDHSGLTKRKCGVMAIVNQGGTLHPGDEITVILPAQPHSPLRRV